MRIGSSLMNRRGARFMCNRQTIGLLHGFSYMQTQAEDDGNTPTQAATQADTLVMILAAADANRAPAHEILITARPFISAPNSSPPNSVPLRTLDDRVRDCRLACAGSGDGHRRRRRGAGGEAAGPAQRAASGFLCRSRWPSGDGLAVHRRAVRRAVAQHHRDTLAAGFPLPGWPLRLILRRAVHGAASGKVMAASGTTSDTSPWCPAARTTSSTCFSPGATGLALIGTYQVELFWFGIASNWPYFCPNMAGVFTRSHKEHEHETSIPLVNPRRF